METKRIHENENENENENANANKKLKQSQPDTVEEWETLMMSRIGENSECIQKYRRDAQDWYTRNEFNYEYDGEDIIMNMTYETLKKVYMDIGAMETEEELQAYFAMLLEVQKCTLTWIDEQEENREYSKDCVFPNTDEECDCPECHGNHQGDEDDEEFEMCEDCMDGATGNCTWCTYHQYTCGKN
jgi:hypothetical protein